MCKKIDEIVDNLCENGAEFFEVREASTVNNSDPYNTNYVLREQDKRPLFGERNSMKEMSEQMTVILINM